MSKKAYIKESRQKNKQIEEKKCYICHEIGHLARGCKKTGQYNVGFRIHDNIKNGNGFETISPSLHCQCVVCGQPGHKALDCNLGKLENPCRPIKSWADLANILHEKGLKSENPAWSLSSERNKPVMDTRINQSFSDNHTKHRKRRRRAKTSKTVKSIDQSSNIINASHPSTINPEDDKVARQYVSNHKPSSQIECKCNSIPTKSKSSKTSINTNEKGQSLIIFKSKNTDDNQVAMNGSKIKKPKKKCLTCNKRGHYTHECLTAHEYYNALLATTKLSNSRWGFQFITPMITLLRLYFGYKLDIAL